MIAWVLRLLVTGVLVVGAGAYLQEAEMAEAEERQVSLPGITGRLLSDPFSAVQTVTQRVNELLDETRRAAKGAELRNIQQMVDVAVVSSGKRSVEQLPNYQSITPENYSSGPYREYLRSAPMCNYTVAPNGTVRRSPSQPDTCK